MPNLFSTPLGLDYTKRVQLRHEDNDVVTSYTGDEPLDAYVWRGGDQPVLFSPSVTWDDPSQGKILVTFLGSDTSGLESGKYQVRVLIGGQPIPDGVLDLASSPGSAPALKAYCTYQDMYDYFYNMDDILDPNDQTGFARQRYKARTWTDRVIMANRRNSTGYTSLGVSGPLFYSGSWGGGQTDPVLQAQLDNDMLMLTPMVIEINAKMALAYACEGEIGPTDKPTQWQSLAAKFRSEAESIACMLIAEIDLNGDGYAERWINCGMTSNR